MQDYKEFLASKRVVFQSSGIEVDPGDVHPMLFPFQRDLTVWALRKGKSVCAANTGMGKTYIFAEFARLCKQKTLIVAPLVTIGQTCRMATAIDVSIHKVRSQNAVDTHDGNIFITNYEIADRFNPDEFGCIVLDEASIIKHESGKYRQRLTEEWQHTPFRLCATATPAPNSIKEIGSYAHFLGVMTIAEMQAAFFVHKNTKKSKKVGRHGWSLKGHAKEAFYNWLASWCMLVHLPSDLGYPDDGFILPEMNVHPIFVKTDYVPNGQLMFTGLSGVGDRAAVRQATFEQRVGKAAEIVNDHKDDTWICWCGLNSESRGLTKAIEGAVEVTGAQSAERKAQLLDEFLKGQHRALVTKPSIAGYGMNFQEVCHNQVFVGLSDSWESYRQAWARLRRFGQGHVVNTYIVLADVEDAIYHNVMRKAKQAEVMGRELVKNVAQYELAQLQEIAQRNGYNPQVQFELPAFLKGESGV